MGITAEHEKKAQEWIAGRNIVCLCCRGRNLSVDGPFTPVMATADAKVIPARETAPIVQMACHECGHVSFFSAVVMGLLEGAEDRMH
jgi:hypothetical protein